LIIDYGPDSTIPTNSLRGIRSHTRVSPFEAPGAVDLSADVDFLALAESAINASPGVEVHGPVDQARFLMAMGIEARAAQLMKTAVDKERAGAGGQEKEELSEMAKRVESGWKRLIDRGPQGMGRLYKAMAIVPYNPPREGESRRRPVGFGGDVQM
jgi:SAM-dependent MidA family methyltransferase